MLKLASNQALYVISVDKLEHINLHLDDWKYCLQIEKICYA